jgi:hypothetical protein
LQRTRFRKACSSTRCRWLRGHTYTTCHIKRMACRLADLQSCNLSAGAAKATFALSHHSVDEVLQIALGRKVWSCGRLDRLELHSFLSLEGFESQSATPLLNSGTATIGKCSSSSTRGSNSSVHPELAPCASQAKGPVFQRSPVLPLSW